MFVRLLMVWVLVGGLSLPIPASALDYGGVAEINWASLTFSGVPIQMDTSGPNVQETAYLLQDAGGVTHLQSQSPFDEFRTNTDAVTYAPLGSVSASADDHALTSSVNLHAVGDASVITSRQMTFQALSAGTLTMSVQYTLQHAGIPPLSVTDFSTPLHTGVGLGGGDGTGTGAEATLTQLSNQLQQSGTFTLTHQFQAGEMGGFSTVVDVTTHAGQSVPIPDMFWPASALLIVGCVVARRRMA